MSDELQISKALAVLERIVAAMCRAPEKLTMDARIGTSVVEINFKVADTVDSKRIVGVGGSRLTNIQRLVAMMLKESGKKVILGQVEKEKECAVEYTQFEADDNWPSGMIEKLFKDTVEAYFPANGVMTRIENNGDTTKLFAVVPKLDAAAILFGKVAYEVFVPIGIQQGRRLIADVEEKNDSRT